MNPKGIQVVLSPTLGLQSEATRWNKRIQRADRRQCFQNIPGAVVPRNSGDFFMEWSGSDLIHRCKSTIKDVGIVGQALYTHKPSKPSTVSTFLSLSTMDEEGRERDERK